MATIWFLKEGEIQTGPAEAEKPLDWCIKNLGLRQDNWWADLTTTSIVIGEKAKGGLGPFRGFRYVLVEVNQDNIGKGSDWPPGFYLLDTNATDARKILGL
jgi:hypothetical protein